MVSLHGVHNILAPDSRIHIEKLGDLAKKKADMRGLRSDRRADWRVSTPSAAMTVLQTSDVGRILVRATNHTKETISPGATANYHTLLIASNDTKLPVLPNRNISDDRFEFLQRRKPLVHMEPRIHFCHLGGEQHVRRDQRGKINRTKNALVVDFLVTTSIGVCGLRSPEEATTLLWGGTRDLRDSQRTTAEDVSSLTQPGII